MASWVLPATVEVHMASLTNQSTSFCLYSFFVFVSPFEDHGLAGLQQSATTVTINLSIVVETLSNFRRIETIDRWLLAWFIGAFLARLGRPLIVGVAVTRWALRHILIVTHVDLYIYIFLEVHKISESVNLKRRKHKTEWSHRQTNKQLPWKIYKQNLKKQNKKQDECEDSRKTYYT